MEITEKITPNSDGEIDRELPAKRKRSNPFVGNCKEDREKRRQKRARLIIRNISFKVTEKTLKEHFEPHGTILNLNILKHPDGKLVGCAFIQYETVNQAAKAILKTSNKEFLGRTIFVDWALGKDEYKKMKGTENETKPKVEPKEEIKSEKDSDEEDGSEEENEDEDEEDDTSIKTEDSDEEDDGSGEEDNDDEDNDDDEDDDDDDDKKDVKSKLSIPKEKFLSNDVKEGCTIFIKYVPFDADNDDIGKVCAKFGPLYYSIVNRDHVSGHSKGTAFVKFKTKESADLCLAAGPEFVLNDTQLNPFPALSREEMRELATKRSSKEENKDSRNLFLAREGLIMTGSKAADGVSASDMTRRHKLEQVKNHMLKNLNRFVSRNRLSIHNLPLNYDNQSLRNMVITHTGFTPHECRVIRENRITPEHPSGKGKGFGFMSFTTHKDALTALRKLNNNPTIFGNIHRPIVAFSIEDRTVHKIKDKRLEKSKLNNPTYKDKLERRKEVRKAGVKKMSKAPQADNKAVQQKHIKKLEASRASAATKVPKPASEMADFVGFIGKKGSATGTRSNKKIMEQAQEHKKKVGEQKRKDKQKKQKMMHRLERQQVDRTKQGKKKGNRDDLSHLVNKYKKLIDRASEVGSTVAVGKSKKKTKWYKE